MEKKNMRIDEKLYSLAKYLHYCIPLKNLAFSNVLPRNYSLAKYLHSLAKVLCFPNKCVRSQNIWVLLQKYCVPPRNCLRAKHLRFLAKVLRSPKKLCSLSKHLRSLAKVLHPHKELCVCSQNICVFLPPAYCFHESFARKRKALKYT